MDIRASLAALSASSGPSGREQQTLERAMELLRPLVDEVSRDRFGNLIGVRRCGKENAKRVVLDAHLDEVGLVITGAKDGFLRFRSVGGIDPRMLPDREVTILSDPPSFGLVAVLPPHVQRAGDANKSVPMSDLYIDAGLTQEEGEMLIGTFVVTRGPFRPLLGEVVSGKAMDDRAGFVTLLRTAELLKGIPLDVDLYILGSSREEVNGGGPFFYGGPPLLHCCRRDPRPHPRWTQRRNISCWEGDRHRDRFQHHSLDQSAFYGQSQRTGSALGFGCDAWSQRDQRLAGPNRS